MNRLLTYFEEEKNRFEAEPESAKSLLEIGEYPQKEIATVPEMAAYTIVANMIFNLDETITRG